MQKLFLPSALIVCALLAACGNSQPAATSRQNSNSAANVSSSEAGSGGANMSNVGVVSSHGGGSSAAPAGAMASDKPPVATPELDAKIEKAVAKGNAKGATAADKKAAAEAYLERANFYWGAGNVQLYKFALGDYRRVLKYDPENTEAKNRIAYLISVYHSINKPVPDNGLEN